MNTKEELVKRWDIFLNTISKRFNDILEQAKAGTEQLIPQLEYDAVIISNVWTGIKGQLNSLTEKVSDTWNDKMDDLFDDLEDVTGEERMKQYYKYYDLNQEMEAKYDEAYTLAIAIAGEKISENVMKHIDLNKIHNCKQCGDKMDIKIYSFMAKNVKCTSCNMVNSYEPDPRILALEHFTIVPLANKEVYPIVYKEGKINHEIHKLDNRVEEENEKIQELRKQLISTRKERVTKFYDFIVHNVPDKAEYYNTRKEERLKWAEELK